MLIGESVIRLIGQWVLIRKVVPLIKLSSKHCLINGIPLQHDPKSIRQSVGWSIGQSSDWTHHIGSVSLCLKLFGLFTKFAANRKFVGHCEISSRYEQFEQSKCSGTFGNHHWFRGILRVNVVPHYSTGRNQWEWLRVADQRNKFATAADFPH